MGDTWERRKVAVGDSTVYVVPLSEAQEYVHPGCGDCEAILQRIRHGGFPEHAKALVTEGEYGRELHGVLL